MRVNRVRQFKNSFELTATFSGEEAEYIGRIVSILSKDEVKKVIDAAGYADYKQKGAALLRQLDTEVFWNNWATNLKAAAAKREEHRKSANTPQMVTVCPHCAYEASPEFNANDCPNKPRV